MHILYEDSNISLSLRNKLNVRLGSVQQTFTMMKAFSNPEKNSVFYGQKRTSNVKIAHFFFPCYVRTVRTVYLEDFKPVYAVLHLILKN